MSRYNPDTSALRAEINSFYLPPRTVFRYPDVKAQKNRCRRRIHGLNNNTEIPGGHILSAITIGGPSGSSCIVTFSRTFAADWAPTNAWQLASVDGQHTTGPLDMVLNTDSSIQIDIDGAWQDFPGPWTIAPLSPNSVEFSDGGNLTSVLPFEIADSTGVTVYHAIVEEVAFNPITKVGLWGFISDNPDGYGAYFRNDNSDDVQMWDDFQIQNDVGSYVSPISVVSGGADGDSAIYLSYPTEFNELQSYKNWRIRANGNAAAKVFTSQIQSGDEMLLELPVTGTW